MALLDVFRHLFARPQPARPARLLEGFAPVFSQFGNNVYASDLVQMAVDCIAVEVSKLQPKHIRTAPDGTQEVPRSALNRLFRFGPNPLMTTRDFLEKTVWLLYTHYNAFIYPLYETVVDARGHASREYTALYPLQPATVAFLQDQAGTLLVELRFGGGEVFTLPYADLIHLRKRFSQSSIMGGGLSGQPDHAALLKVLAVNDTVL